MSREGSTFRQPGARGRLDGTALAGACLLAAAVIAAYAGTFRVPLLFDDVGSIADNPSIRSLVGSLHPPSDLTVGGRPVLNLSLAVNHAISGTSVWSYHAVNLAIHVLAALTLLGIVRRTLAHLEMRKATLVGLSVALLWGLHPILTESVTYIVQRAESLMGLFYLLSLYCLIREAGAAGPVKTLWGALCVASCALGMGTKEVMVSAPLLLLLYDRTFLAGSFREAWSRRRSLYCGLAATWILLLVLVLSAHGRGGTAGPGSGVSPLAYALVQLPAMAHYLRLCFWPGPLIFDYGTAPVAGLAPLASSALLIAGLLALTIWCLFRRPALGFLGAAFFAVLAPSSSFVPVATEAVAEHRMYLALIPVVVLAVFGAYRWLGRAAPPLCVAVAVGLAGATWQRNKVYRSDEGIWRDTVKKLPASDRAHSNLADILEAEGRTDDAFSERETALRLRPDSAITHNNLGKSLAAAPGRMDEAILQFETALALKPDLADADSNLGNALLAEGRVPEAITRLREAVRLAPDLAPAHSNLGNALAGVPGELDEAIAQYGDALRLRPDYAAAHNNLGSALARTPGRMSEAVAQFEEAVRLKPDYAAARFNLAIALLRSPGSADEAVAQLKEVIRLQPGNARAREILGQLGSER
jgi:tetratricopeptide (TPR) repeat protein